MIPEPIIAALSGATITLCVLVSALAWRDVRTNSTGRVLAALAVSIAALEATTGPIGNTVPQPIWLALRVIGGFNVALLWLFCLMLLHDGVRIRGWVAVAFAVFSVGPITTIVAWPPSPASTALAWGVALAPFFAIGHVAWIAISERRGDLVERRLRARFWIPVVLASVALVSVASEFVADDRLAQGIRLLCAGFPGALLLSVWLLSLKPDQLAFAATQPTPLASGHVDPRDQPLLDALETVMAGGLYREHGLTLDVLSEHLKSPAHRLRAVINQGLGYRNFAAFVNSYRLRHAKSALSDPGRGRDTVLVIAFEAGFAALQTFNRVFKEAEGVTPSAYREAALAAAAHNQKKQPIS